MNDSATPSLRIVRTGDAGDGVLLPTQGTLVIGASAELAGYVVDGQGVEDAHCAIGPLKDGGWGIKDLGSRFGTFVNGAQVDAARLEAGDVVVIGGANLRVFDPARRAAPEAETEAPAEARLLGGYRIERALGRGGMGEVLLATQESLHRPVALKLLSKKLASDRQFVSEFHSEARAAAALSHPNVVVVYDVAEFEGEHVLAMEYMPGGSLEDRIQREGRIPWRAALDILHNAASGLAYAESKGIVHRDIKPANLMVAASGTVKIADLGLAKSIDELESDDQESGRQVFGTPHFISPEQARGLNVDHRSDLYSLGASAYRMLSGRTPFEGASAREIVRARFVQDPPPLSRFVPNVPHDVGELVRRLMARDPEQRFASATALLSTLDLLRLRADHGPPDAADEAEPEKRRSWLVAVPLVVIALGIGGWYLSGAGGETGAVETTRAEPATSGSAPNEAGAATSDPAGAELDSAEFYGAREPGDSTGREDNEEVALDQRERAARNALRRIPVDLRPEDRLIELELVAESHAGTDTASAALSEIARIEADLLRAKNRGDLRDKELALGLIQLRTSTGWPPDTNEPPPIHQYLRRIEAFLPPAALQNDAAFEEARAALAEEVVRTFEGNAATSLARVDELARAGTFDGVHGLLSDLFRRLDPGERIEGESEGIARLRALRTTIAERIANLGSEEEVRRAELGREDRALIARELGRGTGTHHELWDLKLSLLEDRLESTREKLRTNGAIGRLQRFERRIDRARAAIVMLLTTHTRGDWRRKSVSIPSGRRTTGREIVRMVGDGLVVSTADDGTELLPWSVLTRSDDALIQLFHGRLTRPYEAQELGNIATLLSFAAVGRAVDAARPGLDLDSQSLLSPSTAQELVEAFDGVLAWMQDNQELSRGPRVNPIERDPGPVQLLADTTIIEREILRERTASELLTRAVLAYQEGAFTEAISRVEYLLGEFDDTFLVLLLSDGSQ